MSSAVWLIPAFPLAGALLNILFGRITGRRAHWIAVPALAGSFVASWMVFSQVSGGRPLTAQLAPWIVAGEFDTWITAHVDHRLNVFKSNRWGLFGFFERERDPSAAGALLDATEAWLRERRRDRMLGPLDFSTNHECGLLIEVTI